MKINRAHLSSFVSLALCATLAGCATAPAPVAPAPSAPPPRPAQRPAPPPVAAPAPEDWRDAAQTPGDWRYAPAEGGSEARFGAVAGQALVVLRCDRAARTVTLYRNGAASMPVPASITTSSETRPLSAAPVDGASPPMVAMAFANGDRLLDAMAFSRGRFVVDVNGLPVLYLPAWAEVGRVVEDCRKG